MLAVIFCGKVFSQNMYGGEKIRPILINRVDIKTDSTFDEIPIPKSYFEEKKKEPVLTNTETEKKSAKDTSEKHQIKLTLKKDQILRLTVDGVYAGLYYKGIQNLDTGGHNPKSSFVLSGEGKIKFWVGKYKDGSVHIGWLFNSTRNLDGFGGLSLPLDNRLTLELGFPEKPLSIVKNRITDEERHRNIETLEMIQSSGPGATIALKLFNKKFMLSSGAFLKNQNAELGASLKIGKWFRMGGAYYDKRWSASLRVDTKPVDVVLLHMKDSASSVYLYVKPWKPEKIVSSRPLGYMDFWGTATYSHTTKKVAVEAGFYYTIPIPFLTKTDYTFVQLGASSDFKKEITIWARIFVTKYDF